MAEDLHGKWRTIGGRRVFIRDGEDLETAMKNSGKFKNMWGQDRSKQYLRDKEIHEVETLAEMKKEVQDYLEKAQGKRVYAEIHLEKINEDGSKSTSRVDSYTETIERDLEVYKKEISHVTLATQNRETARYSDNKVEINLKRKPYQV